ncbi:GMC family oxidoreductase [Pseudovibrio sp. Tun.PSC04-5.I4]|uniref:FAD-dependent oxidoreductase n=1 Tax=Pseudovibrio sp. Tun.PSC04-5.I4 TaxID=1798213 RepID=UPI00088FF6FE|nr:GMC family oxidoreductase [Pseudovibrio sp. Tun.PSC04-5.I4]SDQ22111.1 Choline dehydrogenase [Pseudovibrio sp. Tun.PSC04-5.I4]
MIFDLQDLEDNASFETDICIIGAGAAGIVMALELSKKYREVILIEAGGLSYEDETQELYDGPLKGHTNTDLSYSRLRQFGGTTGHWTGQCAPLDPIDFEARDCTGNTGWPIARADLDPFYERSQFYLELGEYKYSKQEWDGRLEGAALNLPGELVHHSVYQQSPPTRFATTYQDDIAASKNIRCILHANVTDIQLADGNNVVEKLTVKTLGGKQAKIAASRFVLACGGIENARILLATNKQRSAGLGNENDLVGRYFMDHLNIETSSLMLSDDRQNLDYYSQATDSTDLRIGLKVNPALVRERGLLNNTAFLSVVWKDNARNDDFRDHAWLSFSTLAKTFAQGEVPERLSERACNVLESPSSVFVGITRNIKRRLFQGDQISHVLLRQDAEQAPNRDSRVTLTNDRDALGMRRAALDWRVATSDLESLNETHKIVGRAFGAAGLGRLQLGITDPTDLSEVFTGYHHMGTTRMHTEAKQGVVDEDCRLHSLANLYVAGSSVFPTCGAANPTLTIVALAIRLSDHLSQTPVA